MGHQTHNSHHFLPVKISIFMSYLSIGDHLSLNVPVWFRLEFKLMDTETDRERMKMQNLEQPHTDTVHVLFFSFFFCHPTIHLLGPAVVQGMLVSFPLYESQST